MKWVFSSLAIAALSVVLISSESRVSKLFKNAVKPSLVLESSTLDWNCERSECV